MSQGLLGAAQENFQVIVVKHRVLALPGWAAPFAFVRGNLLGIYGIVNYRGRHVHIVGVPHQIEIGFVICRAGKGPAYAHSLAAGN